ncbi:MAG: tetratricopeptide repeat protein [Planctomycetes bacterium]|nr:tetratricopeptide repeat protein [Planctomycetota bacterium]
MARAWARRGVGDQKGSEADVRRAQILAPDSLDVLFEIAQQLEARGDPAGAIAIYKRMLTIDPEDPGALNNLAARYLETGRHEGVEVLLRKILAKQPHDSMALANLSSLYLHKGRLQEAYELALSAVDQSPSAYQEREQFARVLIGLGKHDEALAQLERVLLNHPKRARAHYLRSMALFHKEQWDSAIAALSEAIGIAPTFPEYLKQRALQYQKQKRYSEALHDLDRLLKLTPTAEIYTVRGWTRAEAGDLAGALSDHGNALRIDPQAEQARLNRSKLLQDAGRPREAIEDLEQLVEQSPQRAIYRYHLAALRLALKDFPGSRADSQRYRLLAPRDPSGCVLEGRARAGLREFREAVACYDSALELNAKHVMALAYKAEALRELKEWAHVVETIDRLLPLLHASKSEPIRDARQDALNRLKKAKRAPPR